MDDVGGDAMQATTEEGHASGECKILCVQRRFGSTLTVMVSEAQTPDDYKHPRCYTNLHGGCSTRISGEHYLSHSLIKLYTWDDPSVTIQHDHGFGIPRPVRPKDFVAKVLCTKHNSDLSAADDAALQFASFLREIALTYLNGNGEWGTDAAITISGDDFQRWVLKLLGTHAAANALSHDGGRVKRKITEESVHLLLDKAQWPETWGLCVAGDPSNSYLHFDPFCDVDKVTTDWCSIYPFFGTEDETLRGGVAELNGVGFALTLFNQGRELPEFHRPENPLLGSVQRPSFLAWELDGVQKRINFTWSDPWPHKSVTFTMRR
ncbi:hypothetical protein [Nocardia araoensis]|uniref:hypothetical protein n=1 Tax=Nocardia araoensis TaxID=228600 RepID=UPI000584C41D|nr:hypothetical protein [Nocardia araoensis]